MFYLASGHQRKTQQRKEEKIWIIGVEGLIANTFACISTRGACPPCGLCGFSPVLHRAKPGARSKDKVSCPPRTLGLTWHQVPEFEPWPHMPDQPAPTCGFSVYAERWLGFPRKHGPYEVNGTEDRSFDSTMSQVPY